MFMIYFSSKIISINRIVKKVIKNRRYLILSPSSSVKIQIMGKTLLGVVNKLLKTKSLLTTPSNVLPSHLKQTFLPIIWIFNKGEGHGIESRLNTF